LPLLLFAVAPTVSLPAGCLAQAQIGRRLGISQMQVSRLLQCCNAR
jgi:hypothetical protein